MRRFATLIIASLCLVNVGGAATAKLEPGWREAAIDVGGRTRWYRVYQPPKARDGAAAVLLLHGGTQSMRKIFRDKAGGTRAWLDVARREGVVLIVPNGTNRRSGDTAGDNQNWNDLRGDLGADGVDDVAFLRQLVVKQTRSLRLDPQRIYVTGASNGGMMTYRLLIETPELFAAGAAFIANLPEGASRLPKPSRPTPLMIVNGTADPLVRWEGGMVGRDRGVAVSTRETLDWWIAANRAQPQVARRESLPDLNRDDGCRLSLEVHAADRGGAPVWLYTADGGGHALPSIRYDIADSRIVRRIIGPVCKDAEGAELAWTFFRANSAATR